MFYATHVFFVLDARKGIKEFNCRAEILQGKEFVQGEHLEVVHGVSDAIDVPMTRQERSHMGLEVLVVEVKSALLAWYTGDFW